MTFSIEKLNNYIQKAVEYATGGNPNQTAIEQAKNAIETTKNTLGVSEDDAKKIVSFTALKQAYDRGGNVEEIWQSWPPELRKLLIYGPEQLKFNQTITKVKTFGTPVAIGTSLLAALGLGVSPAVAVPAALGALIWWLNGLANDWNDVFHWGPQMAQNNIIDLYKISQKMDKIGITNFGQFTKDEISSLLTALKTNGYTGILNPIKQQSQFLDESTLEEALKDIIGYFNSNGITPTKQQVIAVLRGWLAKPGEAKTIPSIEAEITPKPTEFIPTQTIRRSTRRSSKPKIFLGTIMAGRVLPPGQFTRKLDDKIENEQDLIDDIITNMVEWLKYLPHKLTYEVQIKQNPFDKDGERKLGTWAVLAMYISNQFNKRMFLDEILLGPLDPLIYYPETGISKTLQIDITKNLTAEEIKPQITPTGKLRTMDEKGNIIEVFPTAEEKEAETPVAGAVSTTTAPSVSTPSVEQLTEEKKQLEEKIKSLQTEVQRLTTAAEQPQAVQPQLATGVSASKWDKFRTATRATVLTKGDNLNLRSGGGLNWPIIDKIPNGSIINLRSHIAIVNDGYHWYQVEYNGKVGFVAGEFLVPF